MKKNWRLIETVRICSQDVGMEFGIEKCAMLIIKIKSKNGKNRTVKSRKNQNVLLEITSTWNIGSEYYKTSRDERKNNKRVPQTNEKTCRNQTLEQ